MLVAHWTPNLRDPVLEIQLAQLFETDMHSFNLMKNRDSFSYGNTDASALSYDWFGVWSSVGETGGGGEEGREGLQLQKPDCSSRFCRDKVKTKNIEQGADNLIPLPLSNLTVVMFRPFTNCPL